MSFYKNPKTSDLEVEGGILGAAGQTWTIDKELRKPVKLADHGFALCADGDEIWGFVDSINPALEPASGAPFGGVLIEGRVIAANVSGSTALAIGDCVVAGANAALGTAQPYPLVKVAVPAAGKKYWRVVDLRGGTGAGNATLNTVTIQSMY